jgi:hypothetical protein
MRRTLAERLVQALPVALSTAWLLAQALPLKAGTVPIDTEFHQDNGRIVTSATAVLLQPDGRLLLGGLYKPRTDISRFRIIRLNQDGSLDVTFVQTPEPVPSLLGAGSPRSMA